MDRLVAAQRLAGDLLAAVGDHLVHIHVELRAAAGHPDVERELVLVLALQDLVADADDQVLRSVAEAAGLVIDQRGRLLDDRVGGDHFPRDQVVADAEMLQGSLRLGAPELVGRDVDRAETVIFDTSRTHGGPFARARTRAEAAAVVSQSAALLSGNHGQTPDYMVSETSWLSIDL